MADKQNILMVDEDPNISHLVRLYLEKEGFGVTECDRGDTAAEAFRSCNPALVLLDVMLPGKDGLEVLKEIRRTSKVPVIMLTARDETFDKVLGLELGADDYITKPFENKELVARVKAVLRRSSRHGDDRELSCEELRIFPGRHQVYCDEQPVELTRKEFELLLYLMENRGIVMTRDQILCHIWGYDFDGETRTVDVHVRTLRQKLGDAGRLIETVRGVGYRMADKGGSQG